MKSQCCSPRSVRREGTPRAAKRRLSFLRPATLFTLGCCVLSLTLLLSIDPGLALTPPTPSPMLIPVAESGVVIRVGQTVRGIYIGKPDSPRYAIFGPAGSTIS